ncbi:NAD(P)-binding protein [Periconia macrospinosa]|uniref:NAD(P)-binding protein n=1 Tax=Periconia macrospinosa TaxID=97972 RepID=A0A2V1DG37_9PLEO|nr:NAD(P)-binding protein [Periconia macrospinosa]
MAPKLFITGGTGYIGGSVLHTVVTSHPEYEVTALLRTIPATFSTTYPNVKIVKGDYDSSAILTEEAYKADVVIHNGDSDHEPSLNALIRGLLLPRPTPGYLLHLSGTGIVADWSSIPSLGHPNPKIWSDINDLDEIRALPDNAFHRNTEKILHATAAANGDRINIAIICPPDIYGKGKGLGKTWSALAPMFAREVVNSGGEMFYYGEGTNTRSWVHIDDLMGVYLKVVEAAVAGGGGFGWNKEGYYFASTQEHTHLAVANAIASILKSHNIIKDITPVQISLDQLDSKIYIPSWPYLARYLFASNSRTRAERAEKLWGYKASAPWLLEALEEEVLDAVKKV